MNKVIKFAGAWVLAAIGVLLLILSGQSSGISATGSELQADVQTMPALTLTPTVFLPIVMYKWPPVLIFSDEFDDNGLDPAKWITETGTVTVADGKLTLSNAAIRSKRVFTYGVLQAKIGSSDWKAQSGSPFTDSSFGFERWYGVCHYGVLFKANGHLGVLENSNCPNQNEKYPPIPNWNDTIKTTPKVFTLTLTWLPNGVTLFLSDGGSYSEVVTSTLVPTVPLNIRLNAYWTEPHTIETYTIDYVRVYQDP